MIKEKNKVNISSYLRGLQIQKDQGKKKKRKKKQEAIDEKKQNKRETKPIIKKK